MIRQGFLPFLPGLAVYDAQVASAHIAAGADHQELAQGLEDLETNLKDRREDNPLLRELYDAVQGYREAVQLADADLIAGYRQGLSQAVGKFTNEAWRQNTFVYFESAFAQRFYNIVYLADTFTALKRIQRERLYVTTVNNDDKAYMRGVVGGLSLFFANEVDGEADAMLTGRVTEIREQLELGFLQTLSEQCKIPFPVLQKHVPKRTAPAQQPTPPPPAREAASPAPEPAPTPARADEKTASEPPAVTLLPFDYHPESAEELDNKAAEHMLGKLQVKVMTAGVPWPYDFSRWVRTLYRLAAELPNGDSARVRSNVSRGLTRLNDLPTIDVADIRRILGPVTIAIDRPLDGLPGAWPKDMANDFGSAMVVIWDASQNGAHPTLAGVANAAVALWAASTDETDEAEIRGDLKSLVRSLERTIREGEDADFRRIAKGLQEIAGKISEGRRPAFDVPLGSDVPTPAPAEDARTISQAQWVKMASRFLTNDRGRWADPEDGRPIAEATRLLDRLLAAEPRGPRASRMLTLLFHLTTTYRQLSGVSGEAALALGKEADAALTAEDITAALESLAQQGSLRLDIIEDLARTWNQDPNVYPTLLGPDGLPDLVGRYVEYLRQSKPDPIGQASIDFAQSNPELGLNPSMVRSVLGYFAGIFEDKVDAALFSEVIEKVAAEPASVDLEASELTDLGDSFRDIDPEKFTPYGRVFIKVCASHQPKLTGLSTKFMMFVHWLSKVYQCYWKEVDAKGQATFASAFDVAFAGSSYKGDPEYRAKYHALFSELLRFLDRNPDLAEMARLCIIGEDTAIEAAKPRGSLHIAGGGPGASPRGDEPDDTSAEPAADDAIASPAAEEAGGEAADAAPTPPTGQRGGTRHVTESDFGGTAVVSADAVTDGSENPFAFDFPGGPDDAPAPAANDENRHSAPVLDDRLRTAVADWRLEDEHMAALLDMIETVGADKTAKIVKTITEKNHSPERRREWLRQYGRTVVQGRLTVAAKTRLLNLMRDPETFWTAYVLQATSVPATGLSLQDILPEPPLAVGRRWGRHVETFDATGATPPMSVSRPAVTAQEAHFEETGVTTEGASFLRYHPRNGSVDIGRNGQKAVGDFMLVRRILKARAAIEGGLRPSAVLAVSANNLTPRARRFFFENIPNGKLLFHSGSGLSVHTAEDGVETVVSYRHDGTELSRKELSLKSEVGDLAVKLVKSADWNPSTHRTLTEPMSWAIRKAEEDGDAPLGEALKGSSRAALAAVGFLPPAHPDVAALAALSDRFGKTRDRADTVAAKTAFDAAVSAIYARFGETAPIPATPPPPKPETDLPASVAATLLVWKAQPRHRKIVETMIQDSSPELVDSILATIAYGNDDVRHRLEWLEVYDRALALKRVSPRAKKRLLELMADNEMFGRVAPLLRIVSMKPSGLSLDRILPSPPLQLGRRHGRFVVTIDGTDDKVPRAVTRPPVNLEEGLVEERAVSLERASVLMWTQSANIDIGITDGRVVGPPHLLRMILRAAGATASGKRTGVILTLFAPSVSERTRRFFYSQNPQGTILLKNRHGMTVYRKNGEAEEINGYAADESLIQKETASLAPQKDDLQVKHIEETDWHPKTHQDIVRPLARVIKALDDRGKTLMAGQLREAQGLAVRAVGFLKPEHTDAAHLIRICDDFTAGGLNDTRIVELQTVLAREAKAILNRFDEGTTPEPVAEPKPAEAGAEAAASADAAPAEAAAANDTKADTGKAALPWTDAIRDFIDRIWPAAYRAEIGIRKHMSAEVFLVQAYKRSRHYIRAPLLANLREAIQGLKDRGAARRFTAELEAALADEANKLGRLFKGRGGNNLSKDSWQALVIFVARIHGIEVDETAIAPAEEPAEAEAQATIPWSTEMKVLLEKIWPAEYRAELGARHRKSAEEFVRVAAKIIRHPDRARILENLRVYLTALGAGGAPFLAELNQAAGGTGPLAGIFHQGGHRVSLDSLRELARFAARITRTPLPEADELRPPVANDDTIPEPNPWEPVERWLQALEQIRNPETTIGFGWLRRELTAALGRVNGTRPMIVHLNATPDDEFVAAFKKITKAPELLDKLIEITPPAIIILAGLISNNFLGAAGDLAPTGEAFAEILDYLNSQLGLMKRLFDHDSFGPTTTPTDLRTIKNRLEILLEATQGYIDIFTSVIDTIILHTDAVTTEQFEEAYRLEEEWKALNDKNELKPLEIDELLNPPQATAS